MRAPAFLWAFAAGGMLTAGYFGQQSDAPVVGPAVMRTQLQKLTGTIVLRALDAIGTRRSAPSDTTTKPDSRSTTH